jgi:hypothetical protein
MTLSFVEHHDAISRPLEGRQLRTMGLGLGLHSTTMLLLAKHGLIEPFDYVLTADTTDEPLAVYEHLRWLQSPNVGIPYPILVVSAGSLSAAILASATSWQSLTTEEIADKALWHKAMRVANPPFFTRGPAVSSRRVVIEGVPFLGIAEQEVEIIVDRVYGGETFGRLNRSCTRDYKIDPQTQELRRLLGIKPRGRAPQHPVVEHCIGIVADEMERITEGAARFIYNRHPMIELRWTEAHCIEWLQSMGYPIFPKSRCKYCPFQTDELWLALKTDAPEDFAEACAIDRAIRNGVRGTTHQLFVHRLCIPLEEIDFEARVRARLPSGDGFLSECMGMCGV